MKLAVINNSPRMRLLVQMDDEADRMTLVEETDLSEDAITAYDGIVFGMKRVECGYRIGTNVLDQAWFDRLPNGMMLFGGLVDEGLGERFRVCEVLKDELFVDQNAVATAYGVLAWMLKQAAYPLYKMSVDVIGYGHCGRQIAALLKNVCQSVRIVTTSDRDLRYETIGYDRYRVAEPSDWIIQTAPAEMIDEQMIARWHKVPKILDISTGHIGVSPKAQDQVDLTRAPALPDAILTAYAAQAYQDAMRRWIDAYFMGRERFVL